MTPITVSRLTRVSNLIIQMKRLHTEYEDFRVLRGEKKICNGNVSRMSEWEKFIDKLER